MKLREKMAIEFFIAEYSNQAKSIDDLFDNYSNSIIPVELYEHIDLIQLKGEVLNLKELLDLTYNNALRQQ